MWWNPENPGEAIAITLPTSAGEASGGSLIPAFWVPGEMDVVVYVPRASIGRLVFAAGFGKPWKDWAVKQHVEQLRTCFGKQGGIWAEQRKVGTAAYISCSCAIQMVLAFGTDARGVGRDHACP